MFIDAKTIIIDRMIYETETYLGLYTSLNPATSYRTGHQCNDSKVDTGTGTETERPAKWAAQPLQAELNVFMLKKDFCTLIV